MKIKKKNNTKLLVIPTICDQYGKIQFFFCSAPLLVHCDALQRERARGSKRMKKKRKIEAEWKKNINPYAICYLVCILQSYNVETKTVMHVVFDISLSFCLYQYIYVETFFVVVVVQFSSYCCCCYSVHFTLYSFLALHRIRTYSANHFTHLLNLKYCTSQAHSWLKLT